jgi:long-chain acyl-CoA synthetase
MDSARPADPFRRWQNLAAMMLGLGLERGDRAMLRYFRADGWESMSWGEFAAQAAAIAHALTPLIPPGAPVLLVSESRPEVPIANVALQAIGAIPMPAYVTNLPADHAHLLRDSGARIAITATAALAARVLEGAGQAVGLDLLICMEPFETAACPVLHWDTLCATPADTAALLARATSIGREEIAVLMYTSGTAGAPRGVLLPHRAILSNCMGAAEVVAPLRLDGESYLSILPLSHTYEYTVGQYFLCAVGCEVIFGRGVETLASDMRGLRPQVMTVVPRVLDVIRGRVLAEVARAAPWRQALFRAALAIGDRRLENRPHLTDRLLAPLLDRLVAARVRDRFGGRLIAIVCGGARLDPMVGRFFMVMGIKILQGYGQTEAGPVISVNPPFAIRVETVGPPLNGVDLRIAADGEILVRGDLMMRGYLGRPEDTSATIIDGWLHTGDIGRIDDGYLIITDRKRDIIVLSGGENVAPARIEGLLMAEPEIAQAVVVGDGAIGLEALVVPAEDATPAAVAAALHRVNLSLAGYEKLRRHRLVEAFTLENGLLTATQKIRRRLVINRYASTAEKLVDRSSVAPA